MCSRNAIAAILLLIALTPVALAQTATGEVNGTVTDPNGGAVPGAGVKLINEATKIEAEAKANQSGYFTFVNVKLATYVLRVEVSGFKRAQTPEFVVGVNQTVSQPVKLEVGNVAETVEVISSGEALQTSSSELGTVIPTSAI